MRCQWISTLQSSCSLSKALNSISWIRRLDSIIRSKDKNIYEYENDLKMEFLKARSVYLKVSIATVITDDASERVRISSLILFFNSLILNR